ncbi:hypothetical protein WOLCODRAFT_166616 [Wolfiporia cocos MD-104 SS10]|uniref:Uncharacterized protein n=1 Tax=Wolfiporia cocos (strain MD-104) TaxID=742152 RepID=A0A2H3JJ53_WOLCO|nr:hypothetical protein WOLCODRAFT_166616 [Wolfiporia cocos MD-104 SS10]
MYNRRTGRAPPHPSCGKDVRRQQAEWSAAGAARCALIARPRRPVADRSNANGDACTVRVTCQCRTEAECPVMRCVVSIAVPRRNAAGQRACVCHDQNSSCSRCHARPRAEQAQRPIVAGTAAVWVGGARRGCVWHSVVHQREFLPRQQRRRQSREVGHERAPGAVAVL